MNSEAGPKVITYAENSMLNLKYYVFCSNTVRFIFHIMSYYNIFM